MRLQAIIERYQSFSQRPIRLPTLIGMVLGFTGILTLATLVVFWNSDTHRYIVDVQRASDNRVDDPDFPLIIPADLTLPPTVRIQPDQLWRAEAAIQSAVQTLDPAADFPSPVIGLDFVVDLPPSDGT